MASTKYSVKIYNTQTNETRRAQVGEPRTLDELHALCVHFFGPGLYKLRFTDVDGDAITMGADCDVQTAVEEMPQMLRVHAERVGESDEEAVQHVEENVAPLDAKAELKSAFSLLNVDGGLLDMALSNELDAEIRREVAETIIERVAQHPNSFDVLRSLMTRADFVAKLPELLPMAELLDAESETEELFTPLFQALGPHLADMAQDPAVVEAFSSFIN
jgi:hypothetical protein